MIWLSKAPHLLIFRLLIRKIRSVPGSSLTFLGQSTGVLLERLLLVFGIRIKKAFEVGSTWIIWFLSQRQRPVQHLKYEKSTESVAISTSCIQKFYVVINSWQCL